MLVASGKNKRVPVSQSGVPSFLAGQEASHAPYRYDLFNSTGDLLPSIYKPSPAEYGVHSLVPENVDLHQVGVTPAVRIIANRYGEQINVDVVLQKALQEECTMLQKLEAEEQQEQEDAKQQLEYQEQQVVSVYQKEEQEEQNVSEPSIHENMSITRQYTISNRPIVQQDQLHHEQARVLVDQLSSDNLLLDENVQAFLLRNQEVQEQYQSSPTSRVATAAHTNTRPIVPYLETPAKEIDLEPHFIMTSSLQQAQRMLQDQSSTMSSRNIQKLPQIKQKPRKTSKNNTASLALTLKSNTSTQNTEEEQVTLQSGRKTVSTDLLSIYTTESPRQSMINLHEKEEQTDTLGIMRVAVHTTSHINENMNIPVVIPTMTQKLTQSPYHLAATVAFAKPVQRKNTQLQKLQDLDSQKRALQYWHKKSDDYAMLAACTSEQNQQQTGHGEKMHLQRKKTGKQLVTLTSNSKNKASNVSLVSNPALLKTELDELRRIYTSLCEEQVVEEEELFLYNKLYTDKSTARITTKEKVQREKTSMKRRMVAKNQDIQAKERVEREAMLTQHRVAATQRGMIYTEQRRDVYATMTKHVDQVHQRGKMLELEKIQKFEMEQENENARLTQRKQQKEEMHRKKVLKEEEVGTIVHAIRLLRMDIVSKKQSLKQVKTEKQRMSRLVADADKDPQDCIQYPQNTSISSSNSKDLFETFPERPDEYIGDDFSEDISQKEAEEENYDDVYDDTTTNNDVYDTTSNNDMYKDEEYEQEPPPPPLPPQNTLPQPPITDNNTYYEDMDANTGLDSQYDEEFE